MKMGLDLILQIKSKQVCEIANDNADGQTIVSGNLKSINELQIILKEKKKKSILLPVSAPFHCSLMKAAADKMEEKINSTFFQDPDYDIVTNVTAKPEKNSSIIKKLLVQQIYTKVRWRETITYMKKNNINEFIEIGPGKVLSGLVKRITKDALSISLNSIEDIKNITK